jgi:HD-GYP domain-containing protein (c-di-GMP phosphodiesterase class II)
LIVSAADAFHAMTSDRPYQRARSVQEAIVEIRRCAGTQFAPGVAEALIDAVSEQQAARGQGDLRRMRRAS